MIYDDYSLEEEDTAVENQSTDIGHQSELEQLLNESERVIPIDLFSDSNDSFVENWRKSFSNEEESIDEDSGTFDNVDLYISIDDKRINMLPPKLRDTMRGIIRKLNTWSERRTSDTSNHALLILHERVSDFLEMQKFRDENYEAKCKKLLTEIYQNIIELQKTISGFKDKAAPRSVDEFQVSKMKEFFKE